jgi:hypothetical protein
MTQRPYMQLPINADEGFPQSFRLNFAGNAYRLSFYVNILEKEITLPDDHIFQLPTADDSADAFMVMSVAREDADGLAVLFRRKLVLNLEYEAAELAFVFRKLHVAKGNLNGIGAFGSEVIGGIAER